MISLFRLLRKKLVEQEKVKTYLLYAIGEIFLIVIGILVALQLNNWNENRKLENEIDHYIQSLKDDLIQDSLLVTKRLSLLEKDTLLLGNFLMRMSSDEATLDTLVEIGRYKFLPNTFVTIAFNNNTITSLRSTGTFSKLENILQTHLLKISELQEQYKAVTALNLSAFLNQAIYYTRRYPFHSSTHINPDSKLSQKIWDTAKFNEYGAQLNGLISVKYALEKNAIYNLLAIQKQTNALLKKLRKDYSHILKAESEK